jgi:hypothetical protein
MFTFTQNALQTWENEKIGVGKCSNLPSVLGIHLHRTWERGPRSADTRTYACPSLTMHQSFPFYWYMIYLVWISAGSIHAAVHAGHVVPTHCDHIANRVESTVAWRNWQFSVMTLKLENTIFQCCATTTCTSTHMWRPRAPEFASNLKSLHSPPTASHAVANK